VVSDWSVKAMTFDKVLPQFIKGKKIRRRLWWVWRPHYYRYIYINNHNAIYAVSDDKEIQVAHPAWGDILADDWEVVEDGK
jgi:hypothetical protein